MKKTYLSLLLAMVAGIFGVQAQISSERIIVRETTGMIKGFLPERVDSIFFEQVEGEVKAIVEVLNFTEGEDAAIDLAVKRTKECQGFRIAVIPPSMKAYVEKDDLAVYYLENYGSEIYYQDFESAQLSGFGDMAADADYYVVTVGYDKFGIACGVDKVTIHTSAANISGNPQVKCSVLDTQYTEFTIYFEPNDDVSEYYYCSFDKGTFDMYYEQFAPMFGFNSPSEMVAMWCGSPVTGRNTHTWDHMNAGTEYEVYVAMKDLDGNFAPLTCCPVKTLSYGGDGESLISIEIGDFMYRTSAETYTQRVIFTANDQTSRFRDMILVEEALTSGEWTEQDVIDYLKSEDPSGMDPYWYQYKVDDFEWELNPSTAYVAYAMGQNANGEWGALCQKAFTTPSADQAIVMNAPAAKPMRFAGRHSRSHGAVNADAFKAIAPKSAKAQPALTSK